MRNLEYYRGFTIKKSQDAWFYDDGKVDQFDVKGMPAPTLEKAKQAIDDYLEGIRWH